VLTLVDTWLREHLFAVVFLGALVDAIGIPFPGRIMLITAGSMSDAARDHGTKTLLVIAVAVLGTVVGDHVWYLLGRLMGRRFVDRYGRRLRISGPRLVTADRFLRRFGGIALILGRLAATLRIVITPLAASRGMSYARFLAFDFVGALLWAAGFVWLGRAAGAVGGRGGVIGTLTVVSTVAAASIVTTLVMRRWLSGRARVSGSRPPVAPRRHA
jgi:membrane protein DedA with SNARE-associated domain